MIKVKRQLSRLSSNGWSPSDSTEHRSSSDSAMVGNMLCGESEREMGLAGMTVTHLASAEPRVVNDRVLGLVRLG